MSFIHYKLITNQNYEKIDFDGVSLSVGEIKKMVMEKKFRKHAPSAASSNTGNSSSRKSDVDLEVTNVDTNEVYKNDSELIPKNSRVQISRVVKNIGPAIAGGTITHTHKDSEKLADLRIKSRLAERQVKNELDLDDSILLGSNGSKNSDTNSQDSPDIVSHLYDDILTQNGLNSEDFLDQKDPDTFNLNNRIDIKIPKQEVSVHKSEQDRPPGDFLCPFDDGQMKHLMDNAIIVPCCGYFICCEKCIRDKLNSNEPIECPHESCSQEITINHRLTPYPPMRNKISEYLKSQSSQMRVPVEKLATKFALDLQCESKISKPNAKVAAQSSPGQSPPSASRPLIKLAVKLNSPKQNQEEKKENEITPHEVETKTSRSESRSPVSSRSSSPSKVSSDSESVNSKISENGSLSPVSQSQESRPNSPTPPSSPKEKIVEQTQEYDKTKNDDSLQPIQSVFNQQYIPQQQFYPYNMPNSQMYPQMDAYFNPRFPRPNFPMQPQAMFNSNMMRFPPPGALHGQNFYQMYPGGHQGYMHEQFFSNRAHQPFANGYQYQSFQRNSKVVRRRSRSRSRSRRSQERSRRKRSYSRSRSRSPRRHHRSSRHRSRSRSPGRRDKRASFKRRSSSRSKRDRSRSRSRDRQNKHTDEKANRTDRPADDSKSRPLNKENEMDQREKTIHKLNNLMHRKSNVDAKNLANGTSVSLTDNQIKESQLNEEKDGKKNQIVILLKTNSKQNKNEQTQQSNQDGPVVSSPVKKSGVKRKVHLKKELAATSTVKKIMLDKLDEKKCSESEYRTEDFLDISIDEKINF